MDSEIWLDGELTAAHFNVGKILGMLGRKKEADEAYVEAVEVAREVSPGIWGKSLAARKVLSEDEVADVEAAIRYLTLLKGTPWPFA